MVVSDSSESSSPMAGSVVSIAAERFRSLFSQGPMKSNVFGVVSEAKAMCSELEGAVELLVNDQRMNELASNAQVDSLLKKLIRLAYDAEDVGDTYISKIESSSNLGFKRLSLPYQTRGRLCKLRLEMRAVMDKLIEMDTTDSQNDGMVGELQDGQVPNGHCKVGQEFVVGIHGDVERLVTMLIPAAKGDALREESHLDVLAIVGMGGSGKTTLARNIFNHRKIKRYFRFRAWVSLSQGWTTSGVLSELCKQLQDQHAKSWIRSKMNKCLVVLDNVWDCKSIQEQLLSTVIKCGYDGSPKFKDLIEETKVVIVGRHNQQPSNTLLKWFFYEVQLLNEEDGWKLFRVVFKSSHGVELGKQYHGVAKENLTNCQGIASAIVELGRRFKITDSNSGEMGRSEFMNLPETNHILALSYHHLPYYLKPCFLYLGLFPKGSTIATGRLTRRWIAESFVKKCNHNETSEEAAERLLQELIEHNIVQVVEWTYAGKPKSIQVLNMMTDLCVKEAQKLDFLYSSESSDQTVKNVSRRAAVINNLSSGLTIPVDNLCLRSLLVFGQGNDQHANTGNQRVNFNLKLVFTKFKLLRVLDICEIRTFDGVMPEDIGNLVHLRYLRIRSTNISKLPDTIGNLRELVTFVYRNVVVNNDGIILPDVLWKWKNLRHLYLPLEKSNRTKNLTLHTLKNLQTLWGVGGGKWMLKEMSKLNPNLNKLCIQGIEDDKQIVDSLFNCPIIKTHDHIRSLVLEWYGYSLEGLDLLCSKKSLQKLRLKGNAPDILKFPFNLQKLELYSTQLNNPESMAALGKLTCLKFLKLAMESYLGSEWIVEGESIFPQLEALELSSLPNLKQWEVEKGAMPRLKRLSIEACPCLKHIPNELRSNPTLEITPRSEIINPETISPRGKLFGMTIANLSIISGQ